ncbi:MAG: hypothetical protein MZV63_64905 [Marinilabiliales bacterium]|nr:hypothetical protein [Marinilabiliales bacterium]
MLLAEVEGPLGRPLEMVLEVGVDVALDPLGRGALEAALADAAGDVALELVQETDLVHRDIVPAGLAAADEQGADGTVFFQDGRQGPDVEVRVENDPAARSVGQLQGVPELLLAVGEEGQAGRIGGSQGLGAVVGDEVEVAKQGVGPALGRAERAGPGPGLAEEVLQGELDLLFGQPALVGVQVERRHEVALGLELGQGLDLGTVL